MRGQGDGGMNLGRERAKYAVAIALYGTIGLFLRYTNFPSELVAMCRGIIGSVFILLYLRVRRHKLDGRAIRANLKWLILSGICLGLNWLFLFAAYMRTTVAIASLCNYMAPIIVILVAPLLLRERLNRRKLPCVFVALVGIVLVSGALEGGSGDPVGILLGLCAALGFVGLVLCNRKLRDIPPVDKAVVQLAMSAVTILPYVCLSHHLGSVRPDARSVLFVIILGVVHTGVAYCLYFSALGTLPVQTIAVIGYLEPVISILCSFFFLHEPLSLPGWIGAVLVVAAAAVSEIVPDRPKKASGTE